MKKKMRVSGVRNATLQQRGVTQAAHSKTIVKGLRYDKDSDNSFRQSASLGVKVDLGDYQNVTLHVSFTGDFSDCSPEQSTDLLTDICLTQLRRMMKRVGIQKSLRSILTS